MKKVAYEWDYDGACAPGNRPQGETFSVGCFQWVPMAKGKFLKRSKVVMRFKGRTDNPQPVFDAAKAWCAEQDPRQLPVGFLERARTKTVTVHDRP